MVLMGGGDPVEEGYRWLVELAGGGDFLVLRSAGGDALNSYVSKLGVDSVESLEVSQKVAAADAGVVERIRGAEAIWLADGSQFDYVRFWQQTDLLHQIHLAVKRGVPVGGTGAGAAVLGQYSFTGESGDITSEEALKNPFAAGVKVTREFFELPHLQDVLVDHHFRQRDRMGRLIVFLARILHLGWERTARAIALDEKTALLVDEQGKARVAGDGSAYFLKTVRKADVIEPSTPLTMRDGVEVYRVDKRGTFDLDGWGGSGGVKYFVKVERGKLASTQQGGSIY
jgi:cyanophycinase